MNQARSKMMRELANYLEALNKYEAKLDKIMGPDDKPKPGKEKEAIHLSMVMAGLRNSIAAHRKDLGL